MELVDPFIFTDASILFSNLTNSQAEWDAGTAYSTLGVEVVRNKKVYRNINATGNTNKPPETSPTFWTYVRVANTWACFDALVNSQSERADEIKFEVQITGYANVIAFLNVSCASILVEFYDNVNAEWKTVRDIPMISTDEIYDAWTYCFGPIIRFGDKVAVGLPMYYSPKVRVTLKDVGNVVKLGSIVLGNSVRIGGTQYGARVGIQDYSRKVVDDFGDVTIVERAFAKIGDFQVFVKKGMVDTTQQLMASYRARPVLYIGSTMYGATILLGFFKDFYEVIDYPEDALCVLQVEGLTQS